MPSLGSDSRWIYLCVAFMANAPWFSGAIADEVELLDGTRIESPLSSIAADGTLHGGGLSEGLKLEDLRRVTRSAEGETRAATAVVDLMGGARLFVHGVEIRDERIVVDVAGDRPWSLPIEIVRGVRCDNAAPIAAYSQSLARPSADVDRFFVKGEEAATIESFEALIEQLTPSAATFELKGAKRELQRERLYGIVFARPANEALPPIRGWIQLQNGSRLPYDKLQLGDGVLKITGPAALKIELAWSHVVAVDVRSARLAFLSDLEPSKIDESSLVVPARSWRRDKSIGGRRLTIGDKSYDKGIGVQAKSSLTFKLDRQFDTFVTSVGIDAETSGEGDCVMAVLADDGRSLWRERVRGGELPKAVRLPVRDVQSLTLVVEAGEDLDLSDHADWAEARLIRGKPLTEK